VNAEGIRAFRLAHGLTLEAFGKLVEPPIDRNEVWKLQTGRRPISAGMRARLRLAMARATAGEG
jgi:hypothetical protein